MYLSKRVKRKQKGCNMGKSPVSLRSRAGIICFLGKYVVETNPCWILVARLLVWRVTNKVGMGDSDFSLVGITLFQDGRYGDIYDHVTLSDYDEREGL